MAALQQGDAKHIPFRATRRGSAAGRAVGNLNKDISFALRRGTIAQVTLALDAAQRAVEDELALDEAGWDR